MLCAESVLDFTKCTILCCIFMMTCFGNGFCSFASASALARPLSSSEAGAVMMPGSLRRRLNSSLRQNRLKERRVGWAL